MPYTINVLHYISDITHKLAFLYQDRTLCTHYAWWIIEAITNKKRVDLLAQTPIELTDQQMSTLNDWITRIIDNHMPIAYLIGWVPFIELKIKVSPPILIPRMETEEWVINLINHYHSLHTTTLSILDLCTGTGCIALALGKAFHNAQITGIDINENALLLAQENAQINAIHNVTFGLSDLYNNLPSHTYDIIVSNPPYIAESEWNTLSLSVKTWEDRRALIATGNGLSIIKQIIKQAPYYIRSHPKIQEKKLPNLFIEIDETQGTIVAQEMKNINIVDIVVHKDLAGKDRIVSGRVINVATLAESAP